MLASRAVIGARLAGEGRCSTGPAAWQMGRMFVALWLLLLSSASSAATNSMLEFVPPDGRCAIEIRVTAVITDSRGRALSGAEIWHLDDLGIEVKSLMAYRVGVSDAHGSVTTSVCHMVPVMYCAKPPTGIRQVEFMVIKEGYGVARLRQSIDSRRLLKEGLVLQGNPCGSSASATATPKLRAPGYQMHVQVQLRGVS